MTTLLVLPMAFYVFYVWCLVIISFRRRVKAISAKKMSIKYFTTYSGETSEEVTIAGRHYDNQFQVPVFYLIGCAAHLAVGQVNTFTLVLAWAFVASRLLHSYIHLGSNNVMHRMKAFAAGWIINLVLWGQLAVFVLMGTAAHAQTPLTLWKSCKAASECILVPGICSHPEAVNQKYKLEATEFYRQEAMKASCAPPPSPARTFVAVCESSKCLLKIKSQ